MRILHCTWVALEAFGAIIGVGLLLFVGRYVLAPVVWLVEHYWNWVNGTFESDFVQFLFAIIPLAGLFIALAVFLACLLGDH